MSLEFKFFALCDDSLLPITSLMRRKLFSSFDGAARVKAPRLITFGSLATKLALRFMADTFMLLLNANGIDCYRFF
jgi:hypothetical protein